MSGLILMHKGLIIFFKNSAPIKNLGKARKSGSLLKVSFQYLPLARHLVRSNFGSSFGDSKGHRKSGKFM